MNTRAPKRLFQPHSPDAACVITWIHFGDLHMTKAGEQNHLNLVRVAIGKCEKRKSEVRDQDNLLEASTEHGLLGTQLGPSKNGKKW